MIASDEGLPLDGVLIWFDADFYKAETGTRWVIGGFEADAVSPPVPFVAPFVGARVGYATEIAKTFEGYGFDASGVIPRGLPAEDKLTMLGAELFDLYAAWAGLNYARANRHEGPVVICGDGTGAIQFMRRQRALDLARYDIDTAAMREAIEGLYPAFESVRWDWVERSRNVAVRVVQDRMKKFLRDGRSGAASLGKPNRRGKVGVGR